MDNNANKEETEAEIEWKKNAASCWAAVYSSPALKRQQFLKARYLNPPSDPLLVNFNFRPGGPCSFKNGRWWQIQIN